jgi:hypothetical protein
LRDFLTSGIQPIEVTIRTKFGFRRELRALEATAKAKPAFRRELRAFDMKENTRSDLVHWLDEQDGLYGKRQDDRLRLSEDWGGW